MMHPRAGFLIVRTFEYLYRHFAKPAKHDRVVYSVPREGVPPQQIAKQYRGIDREALEAWSLQDLELGLPNIPTPTERDACLAMHELECQGASDDDFIFSFADARRVFSRLQLPEEWELIWAAEATAGKDVPPQGRLLGYEPTWFSGDHFSAVCDCLCFPRWHGTDVEGELFTPHYERLNAHALFDTVAEAEGFLRFYQSHDWTETGDYVIAEVRWMPSEVVQCG